jgi:hypothetical protein
MKAAALLVAMVTVAVGVVGLVSPDSLTTARRLYFATPVRLYIAAAVRITMGVIVILSAPHSRWPKVVWALGAVMCLQAVSATLLGPDRARAVLEWETVHTGLLRAGSAVAAVTGGFLGFAVAAGRRSQEPSERRYASHSR